MTDHLQTTLNCGAEPITLAQHVSVSVLVVINQGSLKHDDANIDNVCHLFSCTIMSFLILIRKNVKPNIDFHLVHLNHIQLFPVSKQESKSNSKHTI